MRKHSNVLVVLGLATFVVGVAVVALVFRGGGGGASASADEGNTRPILVARQPITAGMVGDATWMKTCGCGALGSREGCMLAWIGVMSPLRRLQGAQEVTMLSQALVPPRLRGTT